MKPMDWPARKLQRQSRLPVRESVERQEVVNFFRLSPAEASSLGPIGFVAPGASKVVPKSM